MFAQCGFLEAAFEHDINVLLLRGKCFNLCFWYVWFHFINASNLTEEFNFFVYVVHLCKCRCLFLSIFL